MTEPNNFFKDFYKGKQHSFVSACAVCFLAFILVVGLGIIQHSDIPTFSKPVESTQDGKDLFNKAVQDIAKSQDTYTKNSNQTIEQGNSKASLLIRQADFEAQKKLEEQKKDQKAPAEAAEVSKEAKETTVQEPAKPSILDTPWPPSPNKEAPHVQSTFTKRMAMMLVMLSLVSIGAWIALKLAMPFLSRFTGTAKISESRINIIERKAFGPGKAIFLMQVDDKKILLGVTETEIANLSEWPSEQPSGSESAPEISENKKEPAPADKEQEKTSEKEQPQQRNLIKEVIQQHIASLPVPKIHK